MNTEEQTLAYLAGLFDGEGCIQIDCIVNKGQHARYGLQLTLTNVDPQPLRLLREVFDGYVFSSQPRRPGHRKIWRWRIRSGGAAKCLRALLPFLVIKKVEAEIALRFRQAIDCRKRSTASLSISELRLRERYKQEIEDQRKKQWVVA